MLKTNKSPKNQKNVFTRPKILMQGTRDEFCVF
jgi:hypothetical protein